MEASDISADATSDYGSDFTSDEEVLNELLAQLPTELRASNPTSYCKDETTKSLNSSRSARVFGQELYNHELHQTLKQKAVQTYGSTDSLEVVETHKSRTTRQDYIQVEATLTEPDRRSPLERFRSKPMKAFSVTDLVSPSWCELQYWYTLTIHGKKRRTPAMRQGSVVHKTLEDQVHRAVLVEVHSKEDSWGLRIWNVIQGLKTLRETGMTRELEIWAIIDGHVVNGIIDQLSYICPDMELEEGSEKFGKDALPADQSIIENYFMTDGDYPATEGSLKSLRSMQRNTSKIYLTDVKTRGSKFVPKGASFRPTLMQLLLYRLMLVQLATNKTNADIIFDRYDLDADAQFSDSFVAQIGSLNESFDDVLSDPPQLLDSPDASIGSIQVMLEHNSLRDLWRLMIQEFQKTMPSGADSIGKVLKAEYRDQAKGDILGIKTFLYDNCVIMDYVKDEMKWWKGEREAQGVNIEEAFKCRTCEFSEGCEWRAMKIEEAIQAYRKNRSRSII